MRDNYPEFASTLPKQEQSVSDLLVLVNDRTSTCDRPLADCLARLSAEILLNKLESMRNIDDQLSAVMLNTEQRSFVEVFLDAYITLDKDYFDYLDFAKIVSAAAPLPIELLWRLHRPGVLELSLYLTLNDSNVDVLNHFSRSLSDILCGRISESELTNKIVTDSCLAMLSRIMPTITFLYKDKAWANSRKVITQVLNDVTINVIDFIYSANDKKGVPSYPVMYELVRKSVFVDSWLKTFSLQQLKTILSYGPSGDALQAVALQESWTFDNSSKHLVNIFGQVFLEIISLHNHISNQLLVPLSVTEAMDALRQLVSKKLVNWRASLTFLATFTVGRPAAVTELKNVISDLLKQSFDQLDSYSLIAAVLFARQASLEGIKVFPSYADWFQSTFGRLNNSMIDKKKTFTFFIEFLTNLISYEPICFLKVHLMRPPRVIPKCHHLYSSYAARARTRILSLKEVNRDAGTNKTTDEEQKAASEVESALASFSKSGKIPSFVMEMSIFHKPYYIGRFLKLLLEPRQLPTNPDNKMKFIDALLRASKISTTTHASYLNSCNKEGATFVEDVAVHELERMTREMGPLLVSAIDASNSKDTLSLMTKLSKQVTVVLSSEENQNKLYKYVVINLSDHHPPATVSTKVLNMLLNIFCKVNTSLKPSSTLNWGRYYLQLLIECNPCLHHQLYRRLCNLLIGKDHLCLNSVQISSIACLIFHICQVERKFPLVKFAGVSADDDVTVATPIENFVSSIGDRLNVSTDEEKLFSLRFLSDYFSVMVVEDHVGLGKVPQSFITKFNYLCAQYASSANVDGAQEKPTFRLAKLLHESELFQNINPD